MGDLAYEITAITVAIAICACTYYIAGLFDAPPVNTFADAAQSRN